MNDFIPSHRPSSPTVRGQSAGPQVNAHTVVNALRCWWKVATPLGLLFASAAAAAVYLTSVPEYTGEVWVIIRERRDHLLEGKSNEDPRKFIANQIEMMKSPPVLNPISIIPDVLKEPEIARAEDPIAEIKRRVNIFPKGQSEFFVIQFTSTNPKSAALIPNEIARSYLELQRRTEGFRTKELLKLLNDELSQQQGVVENARAAWYGEYKNAIGIAPDEVSVGTQSTRLVAPGIEEALQTQLFNAEVDMTKLDVEIRFQESQPPIPPTSFEIDEYVKSDPKVLRIQEALANLEPVIAGHKERSTTPAANKILQELEKQRKKAEQDLVTTKESLRVDVRSELETFAKSQRESKLVHLQEKRAGLESLIKALSERVKGEQDKNVDQQEIKRDVKDRMFKVGLLKSDFERAQERLDALKRRIEGLGLEQRAPSPVDVHQFAVVPTVPNGLLPYKKMGLAMLGAFLLPFGLAVGIEILVRRVGSRVELEQGGDLMVVCEVAALPRKVRKTGATASKPDRNRQIFAESIDGLRTYLTLVKSLEGMQVLAVASSVSGEGKTTLASQLAISMAGASGEPTLLIDGDIRSPDIHRVFNVDQGPGLVDVLRGKVAIDEAIETGFSEKLHLLTAGQLSSSPHHLVANGRIAQVIDSVRSKYRYIIIDTPPILPASEALVIAQVADATILCVRRDFSRLEQVKEAHTRLKAAGVKVAGAVLTGIPSLHYTHKYGTYYYDSSRSDSNNENEPQDN